MSTAIQPADAVNTVQAMLVKARPQIMAALPRHLSADRLIRVAISAMRRTPELQKCSPLSVCSSIMQAAALGLEPDGLLGRAYLVPYWNRKARGLECQLIVGYKGFVDLARRSGEIESIEAHCVYAADRFAYAYGLHPKLEHVPSDNPDRGLITHVWALARFKGGGHQFEVMTIRDVLAIRDTSAPRDKQTGEITGPWRDHFDEMTRKTALRRLAKLLPLSPEIQRHIASEELADSGTPVVDTSMLPDEMEAEAYPAEPAAPASRLAALEERLAGRAEETAEDLPDEPGAGG